MGAMLPALITIDTEYSPGLFAHAGLRDWRDHFARTIRCCGASGETGIHWQMDLLDRHGLKGVFMVDPLPALVWGNEAIEAVVKPILDRGHDVQLHLHPEWLAFAERNPLGTRTGTNMADFTRAEQITLITCGIDLLERAGAPFPNAFRAGNYGANDDTLHALAACGVTYDSSFAPGMAGSPCAISLPPRQQAARRHCGVTEVPCLAIAGPNGALRHGQVTALSFREMRAAILHAAAQGWPALVLVSHSFEFFNRKRGIARAIVRRRFERLCAWLGQRGPARTGGFDLVPPLATPASPILPMPHNPLRTAERLMLQGMSDAFHG